MILIEIIIESSFATSLVLREAQAILRARQAKAIPMAHITIPIITLV